MWDELRLSVHIRSWPTCWPLNTCWESGHGTTDHKTSLCVSLPGSFRSRICTGYIDKNSLLSWPVLDTNAQTEQHMACGTPYIAHLCSMRCGEGISDLWFHPVFRSTDWEFSIVVFYLFVTFLVPREAVKLSVELLPSLLWWDVPYRAEGYGERMRDVL